MRTRSFPWVQTLGNTRKRLLQQTPGYLGAVSSGYVLMGANILIQVLLVPLYLKFLGKYDFGILVMVLAFTNYAAIGVMWMSGGMARVMGEFAANDDKDGFSRIYSLSKVVFVSYAALTGILLVAVLNIFGDFFFRGVPAESRENVYLAVIAAAVYLVVQYEFSVERATLVAMKKQAAGNLIEVAGLIIFVCTVIPWLFSGGGLEGVLVCLLGGVFFSRMVSFFYWKLSGAGPRFGIPDGKWFPLLKRLGGQMGMGYFLYGIILMTLQADTLFVGLLGGAELAAEFVLVWKIAEIIIQIIWRIPGYMEVYIIQMDANGKIKELQKMYQKGMRWIQGVSMGCGFFYALLGSYTVELWVGADQAPETRAGYWLAGGAIFWIASSRWPAGFAHATVKLSPLNKISGTEVILKIMLIVILFPSLSYLAPLVAINAVHILGIAYAYRYMGTRFSENSFSKPVTPAGQGLP